MYECAMCQNNFSKSNAIKCKKFTVIKDIKLKQIKNV